MNQVTAILLALSAVIGSRVFGQDNVYLDGLGGPSYVAAIGSLGFAQDNDRENQQRQSPAPFQQPAVEESISVTVIGTLSTGIVAIGGETTGTTITAKGITWELDLGKNPKFRQSADKLNGKKAVVQGNLERRKGVEIKERWIVTVTALRAAR